MTSIDAQARDFSDILEDRRYLGLDDTSETVRDLMHSSADIGTKQWGIPLTAAEAALVDFPGRGTFANEVARSVLPLVEGRPDFGGLWIDGQTGGVVIGLTSRDRDLETAVRDAVAGESKGITFVTSAHAWRDVEAALESFPSRWEGLVPDVPLGTVRAHAQDSSVIAEVSSPVDMELTKKYESQLSAEFGVTVRIVTSERQVDTACMYRWSCWDPFRAGMLIRNGSPTSSGTCTMGFQTVGGSYDEQFITAGHCGAAYTSDQWYHQGNGGIFVGKNLGTLLTSTDGIDAMRINLKPNYWADNWILGSITWIEHPDDYRNPIAGETLCAILGMSDTAIKCGYVTDASITWQSSTTGYWVTGADLSVSTVFGDSGSPIRTPNQEGVIAVGINDTQGAHFAKMKKVMDRFPAQILVSYGP